MDDTAATSVDHRPDGPWEFDATVTGCFDDMLRRSIPDYDTMRRTVFEMACRYARDDTAIVDLGCSRGDAISPLIDRLGARNLFIGVEVSASMLESCRERLGGYIQCGLLKLFEKDLQGYYPPFPASVTLAVLTLQFVPLECRQRIFAQCFRYTLPGGVMILVEKVLGQTPEIHETLVDLYHQTKRDNGYSADAVEIKRQALQGVLVPVTAAWNQQMLHTAGFAQVDCIWRCMNFAAWVAVKT